MQYAPLAFPGLIILIIINAAFYGVCVALVAMGLRGASRNRGDLLFVALGIAPFVYYCFLYLAAMGEEGARARDVASWPRKAVSRETMPDTIVIERGSVAPGVARGLVAAGPFRRAFANPTFDEWYVYERRDQPGCPTAEPPRNPGPEHWLGSNECATAAKSAPPALERPYLRLLVDLKASYYKTAYTTGVTAGSILELRWSENAGGAVVAFHEHPTFHRLYFPPMITFNGFIREEYRPQRYEPPVDPRKFVLDAVSAGKE